MTGADELLALRKAREALKIAVSFLFFERHNRHHTSNCGALRFLCNVRCGTDPNFGIFEYDFQDVLSALVYLLGAVDETPIYGEDDHVVTGGIGYICSPERKIDGRVE
jgi:hypothetical protein